MMGPFLVIDDFADGHTVGALQEFVRASRERFAQSLVSSAGGGAVDLSQRASDILLEDLGPVETAFRPLVEHRAPALLRELGLPALEEFDPELELAAHRDGGFFGRHIDTATGDLRLRHATNRMASIVYYFQLEPDGFSGGELLIHPLAGNGAPARIAPRHNRLVAFPSFLPHEVARVNVPGDRFENARFSINCWLHRKRPLPPPRH